MGECHIKVFEGKNRNDDEIVTWAMRNTGLESYKDKLVSNLSGGERQRVWLAMALCQNQIYFYWMNQRHT